MKIASSELGHHSARTYHEQHTLYESLRVVQNGVSSRENKETNLLNPPEKSPDSVQLSDKAQALQNAQTLASNPRVLTVQTPATSAATSSEKSMSDLRLQIIRAILESLTGEKMNVFEGDLSVPSREDSLLSSASATGNVMALDYRRHEVYSESEKTNFYAAGKVLTEDGQSIDFNFSLSMQRSFYFESSQHIQAGNTAYLMDPLVVNLNAPSTQLKSGSFSFDLNADGQMEKINCLNQGSGFLVFDRNGDRKVNDGSEMFGTQSGNGFADLAQYDEDGNGWIDENDSIYEKLGVWSPDESGNGHIQSLKLAGVGAIALGYAQTEFSIKDQNNHLQGQVRATGVFLKENGGVGSVQQVDLKAY